MQAEVAKVELELVRALRGDDGLTPLLAAAEFGIGTSTEVCPAHQRRCARRIATTTWSPLPTSPDRKGSQADVAYTSGPGRHTPHMSGHSARSAPDARSNRLSLPHTETATHPSDP